MNIEEMIVTSPNEVLVKKATTISKKDLKELSAILSKTRQYVENTEHAAGLALPQLGISKRAFVAKIRTNDKETTEIFINPRILPFDKEKKAGIEGCLSIPNEDFTVERFYGVEIMYQGLNGKAKKTRLKGFNARVVQHEYDHLNGVLISEIGKSVELKNAQ